MLNLSLDVVLDLIGSFAFCLSGASMGSLYKMDFFGVYIMAVVTGFGGGCLRDIILGNNLPFLFSTPFCWVIAFVATLLVFIPFSRNVSVFLMNIFDAVGLAFFTIVGIKVGLDKHLHDYQCIIMGVLTSCFGGVLRDLIVNRIPYLFHKEIYAGLSFGGGVLFFLCRPFVQETYLEFTIIAIIFVARVFVILFDLNLPKPKSPLNVF